MRNLILASVVVCFATLSVGLGAANDPVFSGPQIGESLAPFTVVVVYDESAGKEVDPVELAGGKPTLLVFVHKLTRPGVALTRAITSYAGTQSKQGALCGIVWLQDDKAKAEEYLTRARKSLNFKVPVGVSVDGGEGPGAYGLNRNVELTILVAKDNKITANFALVQPSVTEAAKIAGELAKLIDQPAPTQEQLEKLAYPGGVMMRNRTRRPADNTQPQAQLMRRIIAAGDDDEKLSTAVREMEDWVGENRARQQSLGRMSAAVLERGRGNSAEKVLKAWVRKYGAERTEPDKESK